MSIHQRLIYSKNHQSLLREDFIYEVEIFLGKNFFELLEKRCIQKLFFNQSNHYNFSWQEIYYI